MERWKRSTLAGMVLCAGLLTGCGGEYAGMTEGDIVSGSAVSGEAVREKTVSGPAVEDGKKKFRHEEKQDMSSHRFCTDTNLYYVSENEYQIMQARVDGTHRKCIWECKDKEYDEVELLYADKDWLYYDVAFDGYRKEITYRAPVKKDRKGYDVVRFSEKEELVKAGLLIPIYADGDYYFYIDLDTEKFIKYDLTRKKKISEETEEDVGGEMFRGKDYYLYVDESELYIQKTDSTKWEKVSEIMDDWHYAGELAVGSDGELFYPQYITKGKNESRFEICRYDGEQEREFVTWEQLSRAVGEVTGTQEMDVCMPDHLFWQEGRLYIQLQTGWVEDGTYHMEYMILSQGMDGSGLQYEKSLTECMKSYVKERKGKWTDGYKKDETVYVEHMTANDAQCIAMADGKAYLSLYDYGNEKGRLGCYDLKSGKFGWVSKTDNTFYKLGYDQDMNDFLSVFDKSEEYNDFTDEWYWPPSKDEEDYGEFVEG